MFKNCSLSNNLVPDNEQINKSERRRIILLIKEWIYVNLNPESIQLQEKINGEK